MQVFAPATGALTRKEKRNFTQARMNPRMHARTNARNHPRAYARRLWSASNARWLSVLYKGLEHLLCLLHPLFARIGYQRLDRYFLAVEKVVKGFLFDSQSCGQCTLNLTGMSCPMNCPKRLRNGPCGGVRQNGHCEVKPEMPCVWIAAWDGRRRLYSEEQVVQIVLPPVDQRLANTSAWLREVRKRNAYPELQSLHPKRANPLETPSESQPTAADSAHSPLHFRDKELQQSHAV